MLPVLEGGRILPPWSRQVVPIPTHLFKGVPVPLASKRLTARWTEPIGQAKPVFFLPAPTDWGPNPNPTHLVHGEGNLLPCLPESTNHARVSREDNNLCTFSRSLKGIPSGFFYRKDRESTQILVLKDTLDTLRVVCIAGHARQSLLTVGFR